jgi:prepilin signal peptidase PulO-like enzyme (type II secretory pathway)
MVFLELIVAILFGILMGNYTTTLLFRIPRGIEISGMNKNHTQPPCCSVCMHPLKFYEYLPILSWIFSRFKCNYCGAKINLHYFFLEIFGGIISVILYYFFGYSEIYLLMLFLCLMSALSGLIHVESNGRIFNELTVTSVVLGMLYRTLTDGSIVPFLFDLSIVIIFLVAILKSDRLYKNIHRNELSILFLQNSVWNSLNPISFLVIFIIYTLSTRKFQTHRYFNSLIAFCCCTLTNICLKYT